MQCTPPQCWQELRRCGKKRSRKIAKNRLILILRHLWAVPLCRRTGRVRPQKDSVSCAARPWSACLKKPAAAKGTTTSRFCGCRRQCRQHNSLPAQAQRAPPAPAISHDTGCGSTAATMLQVSLPRQQKRFPNVLYGKQLFVVLKNFCEGFTDVEHLINAFKLLQFFKQAKIFSAFAAR